MNAPDYTKEIRREADAYIAVERLAADLAEAAVPIKHIGDGNCGAVIEFVMCALVARGLYSDPYTRLKTPPKKQVIGNVLRTKVFEHDAYRCVHCAGHIDLCVDHIKPESKGGTLDFDNLQTLCRSCNSIKGSKE